MPGASRNSNSDCRTTLCAAAYEERARSDACTRDPIGYEAGLNLHFANNSEVDPFGLWGIVIDDVALDLVRNSVGSCFWRCYALGMTDDALDDFLRDLIDDLPGTIRDELIRALSEQPERILEIVIGAIRTGQIVGDAGQGRRPIGDKIAKRLPQKVRDELEEKLAKGLRKIAGKGGQRIIGRLPAKVVPLIGQISAIKELGCEAPRCLSACRDGHFTNDETWPGIVTDLREINETILKEILPKHNGPMIPPLVFPF